MPSAADRAGHDAALLLRDALLLSLRRGAGPFRSFGQIAVEPRAYQLVPLLMALKLDPVRLLIVDDVGIGKTIEAALIARELLDRGDVERFAVLCPPHLVDQWVTELATRVHLGAVPVTAASAGRLERELPPGTNLFAAYPLTVVSLDYIKSDRRRDEFVSRCPELVIVDEAHACAATGPGRHQRYELLKGLVQSPSRHLVMLTATPHSGDDAAFHRLLGLLDTRFERLHELVGAERDRLREELAARFVQRLRGDIDEWKEEARNADGKPLFPKRETREITYRLSGAWDAFFEAVLDYCAGVVEKAEGDERQQRLSFWGTLALMRCVASSPAAAVQALRTRAGLDRAREEDQLEDLVFDGRIDGLAEDDVEPPLGSDDPALPRLIEQAERLTGQTGDPKLKALADHLAELVNEGFNPVVFCRYIATAHYLAAHLTARFKQVAVAAVTGELSADERRDRVAAMGEAERRLLVATDCLSEGVNLQELFDAVVHYDLSWNPTRHEQREGRVDRYGQPSEIVRTTLMYGANNPVDGAVLDVIIRKAAKIRKELGVPVPLPDEGQTLTQTLLKAVLLKRRGVGDLAHARQMELFEASWNAAAERAGANRRTVFAQRRLKPEAVLPEWRRTLAAIGGREVVERFTRRALARLGAPLEPRGAEGRSRGFKAPLAALPDDVRERLEAVGLRGTVAVDFSYPAAPRCRPVNRSHPLVAVLAETLLERSLAASRVVATADPGTLGRTGCWVSNGVRERTLVALVRVRHSLSTAARPPILVEEATAIAWGGSAAVIEGEDALALLSLDPAGDPPEHVRERAVRHALDSMPGRRGELDAFATRRAATLLMDHRRVREAAEARGRYAVKPILPADVIGLFVLLPRL